MTVEQLEASLLNVSNKNAKVAIGKDKLCATEAYTIHIIENNKSNQYFIIN